MEQLTHPPRKNYISYNTCAQLDTWTDNDDTLRSMVYVHSDRMNKDTHSSSSLRRPKIGLPHTWQLRLSYHSPVFCVSGSTTVIKWTKFRVQRTKKRKGGTGAGRGQEKQNPERADSKSPTIAESFFSFFSLGSFFICSKFIRVKISQSHHQQTATEPTNVNYESVS